MSDVWVIEASTQSLARLDNELRGYLRNRGRPEDEIESVVAQTWIAAGRVFEGRSSLRVFLFAVLRRLICDYHRRAKRRPWLAGAADCCDVLDPDDLYDSGAIRPDSAIHRQLTRERVRAALAEMPPHYAEVVELVLEGHSNFAIADELGIDYNTVRSRYSRGKALLLARLRAHEC